jgi:hypothetical protein
LDAILALELLGAVEEMSELETQPQVSPKTAMRFQAAESGGPGCVSRVGDEHCSPRSVRIVA